MVTDYVFYDYKTKGWSEEGTVKTKNEGTPQQLIPAWEQLIVFLQDM